MMCSRQRALGGISSEAEAAAHAAEEAPPKRKKSSVRPEAVQFYFEYRDFMVLTTNHADWRLGVVCFMTPSAPSEKSIFVGSKERTVARLKLKGIDGRAPPGVASVALFDTTREKLTRSRYSIDGQIESSFLIGAWPLFVGGVIGLVDSVNGRDHCLLNNVKYVSSEYLFQ